MFIHRNTQRSSRSDGIDRNKAGLVPVTLAPVAFGLLGSIYAVVAVGMNVWFVWAAVRVLREQSDEAARGMFRVSLAYLFSVFLAMLLDLTLAGVLGS